MRCRLLGALALSLVSGCAFYEPKPINEHDVLRELRSITLDSLRPSLTEGKAASAFDPSDGLSSDEAVAVALAINPKLRTVRAERGIAEGELVAAGLLPNPDLQVTWLFIEHITKSFETGAFGLSLNWAPPRPGELAAKEARAAARIEQVRAEVAGEEWRLAADVRRAFVTLWALDQELALVETSLGLRERTRTVLRKKLDLGEATRLEAHLAEIEYVDTLRERALVATNREKARQELNELLGLPPLYEFKLQAAGDPLAIRSFTFSPSRLEGVLVERRPDLIAAKHEYEQAEHFLNLAYIQRWPWFRFGPAYARDELDRNVVNRFGVSLGFDLPIANQNQGEIATREAARDKLRIGFRERVHAARAEVNQALRALAAYERLARITQETLKPVIDEASKMVETGVSKGEFNVLQVVLVQDRVLKSRRQLIEIAVEYWRSAYELERALGTSLGAAEEKSE